MTNEELFRLIIQELADDTGSGELIWGYVRDVLDANMGSRSADHHEDSPGTLLAIQPSAIMNVEFAHTDYERAYFTHIVTGVLYVLFNRYAPGNEEVESSGFEMRLQTLPYDFDEQYEVFYFPEHEMLGLEMAILAQLNKAAPMSLDPEAAKDYPGFRRYLAGKGQITDNR